MRKFLFGAAAAVAVLAPAAQASAETGGYVDLALGQIDGFGEDWDSLHIGGAGAVDLSPGWRVQFDVDVNRLSEGGGALTSTNTTAHVYREGDGWAVGGVLSNRDLFFLSGWLIGVEGQRHIGNLVLEGEASIGTLETDGPSDSSLYTLDANGTYYFTPDLSVGVGYQYIDIDEASDSIDTWNVDAEYKFSGSSFSVFGGWSQTEVGDFDADAWRIGGRYAFGDDTLQGRRTSGPRWLRAGLPLID